MAKTEMFGGSGAPGFPKRKMFGGSGAPGFRNGKMSPIRVSLESEKWFGDIWEANLGNMNLVKPLLNISHYFTFRYWIWLLKWLL
ncbi:unnamed protein product [Rhizophagus irregularis]|uniref:Uncharacterized protein n=1 Tax=Rhizophagus irregularis TaxID=588596 RepID=A0A916DXT7_9GLOM|nr:unnamed protein product [Rhizophagus irregularis]